MILLTLPVPMDGHVFLSRLKTLLETGKSSSRIDTVGMV
jgi:hypothetical protein